MNKDTDSDRKKDCLAFFAEMFLWFFFLFYYPKTYPPADAKQRKNLAWPNGEMQY